MVDKPECQIETVEMTVSEALKRVKFIEKQINAAAIDIAKYSSKASVEVSDFGSDEAQKQHVDGLLQSVEDLEHNYRVLKKRIQYTNLFVKININGVEYTMTDLLVMSRKGLHMKKCGYESLSKRTGETAAAKYLADKGAQVVLMYTEQYKLAKIKAIHEIDQLIKEKFDICLATQNLLVLPEDCLESKTA